MSTQGQRTRVAVLGGGPGAIAAVHSLVNSPEGNRFDITVYQENAQLGGKCASFTADQATNHRIYEHGLHVLMGFYDVSLSWLRDMYQQVSRSPYAENLPTYEEVLKPADEFTLCEDPDNSGWQYWTIPFPSNDRQIGEDRPGFFALLREGLKAFLKLRKSLAAQHGGHYQKFRIIFFEILLTLFLAGAGIDKIFHFFHRIKLFSGLRWFVARELKKELHKLAVEMDQNKDVNNVSRQLIMAIGFVGINLHGILDDGLYLPPNDLRSINEQDYKAWMQKHNIAQWPEDISWNSAIVNALYQLPFSQGVSMAAGTTLNVVMRLGLGYAGHVAYDFKLGMGDAVFAPAYLLLKEKVKFKFFNQVVDVVPDKTGLGIESIELAVFDLADDYEPLRKISVGEKEWFSWNGNPELSPQKTQQILQVGEDFDVVVLGFSLGSFAGACPSLLKPDTRFSNMAKTLKTRSTAAVQLWFNKSMEQLGLPENAARMGLSFVHPFNSWSNKSYEIPNEGWQAPAPASLMYFANELVEVNQQDPGKGVYAQMTEFVQKDLPELLANFTPEDLFAPDATSTEQRLDNQYWRANTEGSEQYVLLEAGTQGARLAAGDSGYLNMALAGDWVETEMNSGCFEAAVMAGQSAARAIIDGVVRPASELPRYIRTDNDWVWPPPGVLEDSSMSFFVLKANAEALQEVCDELINRPSGGAITATPMIKGEGMVIVNCVDIGKGYSTAPGFSNRGYTAEQECAFFVPVNITDASSSKRGMIIPYIFVSNVEAVLVGREEFGAPKVTGLLSFNETDKEFSVQSVAIPKYSPESQVGTHPIVNIKSTASGSTESHSEDTGVSAAQWLVDAVLKEFDTSTGSELSEIPLVFLKQFRDVADSTGACYQSITYTPAQITELKSAEIWHAHDFSIELPAYDSINIAQHLGLEGTTVTPVLAGNIKLDFTLPTGEILWQAKTGA